MGDASCPYCERRRAHPLYVYMLSDVRGVDERDGSLRDKDATPVDFGYSHFPGISLCQQNRVPGYRPGKKSTRAGAGFWQLEAVIGPVYTQKKALRIKMWWRTSSRKPSNRVKSAWKAARRFRLTECSFRNPRWVDTMIHNNHNL